MQTALPHENHVESFVLALTQSPEIISFHIIFTPLNTPIYFMLKR